MEGPCGIVPKVSQAKQDESTSDAGEGSWKEIATCRVLGGNEIAKLGTLQAIMLDKSTGSVA